MPNPSWMISDLQEFLNTAYQAAWPKNVKTITDGGRFNGFEEVRYEDSPWLYTDLFYGSISDAGLELVWYQSTAVWANVYHGGLTVPVDPHDVFAFLIEALDAPGGGSTTAYRPRGPAVFKRDGIPLLYRYTGHGDLTRFFGVETIAQDQNILYERTVAGGLIGADPVTLTAEFGAVLACIHSQ